MPLAVEVQSPNHWTNREFPQIHTFKMIWKEIHHLMVVSIGMGVKLLVLPYKSFIFYTDSLLLYN